MMNFTDAVLWWRVLLSELPVRATMRDRGEGGRGAANRVNAVRNLFFTLLDETDAQLLLEVGALDAEASRRFVAMKGERRAIAFEASPATYSRLLESNLPEGLAARHMAIGSATGDAQFHVPVDEASKPWGSLRRRLDRKISTHTVTISMKRLDEAVEASALPNSLRRVALWIDVEGAALDVFKGATALLESHVSAIYVELCDQNVYEGSADALEVIGFLLSHHFVPVARDNQFANAWNLLLVHEEIYHGARETISRWQMRQASDIPRPGSGS